MIILTKELAEERFEARKNFPNATWLPGDDPPVGKTVIRQNGERAIVLGSYNGKDESLKTWWRLEVYWDKMYIIIDYPPYLKEI